MANKIMFYTGIAFMAIATVLLLGNIGDSTFPIFLGVLGIISIGASKYRPMAKR